MPRKSICVSSGRISAGEVLSFGGNHHVVTEKSGAFPLHAPTQPFQATTFVNGACPDVIGLSEAIFLDTDELTIGQRVFEYIVGPLRRAIPIALRCSTAWERRYVRRFIIHATDDMRDFEPTLSLSGRMVAMRSGIAGAPRSLLAGLVPGDAGISTRLSGAAHLTAGKSLSAEGRRCWPSNTKQ
tara:strand:+ start:27198 stop:27749 length:552 start_codon:yes stop_codon:yes gene_type:complete